MRYAKLNRVNVVYTEVDVHVGKFHITSFKLVKRKRVEIKYVSSFNFLFGGFDIYLNGFEYICILYYRGVSII